MVPASPNSENSVLNISPNPTHLDEQIAQVGLKDYEELLSSLTAALRGMVEQFPKLRLVMMGVLPEGTNILGNQEYFAIDEISQIMRVLDDTKYLMFIKNGDWSFINLAAATRVFQDPRNADLFHISGPIAQWLETNFSSLSDQQYGVLSGYPRGAVNHFVQYQNIHNRILADLTLSKEESVVINHYVQIAGNVDRQEQQKAVEGFWQR